MNETLRDENETYLEDGEPTNLVMVTPALSGSIEQMIKNSGMSDAVEQINQKSLQDHQDQTDAYNAEGNEDGFEESVDGSYDLDNTDNNPQDVKPKKPRKQQSKGKEDLTGFAARQRETLEKEQRIAAIKEQRYQEEIELRDKEIQRKNEEVALLEENYKLQIAKIKNDENLTKVKEILIDSKVKQDYALEVDAAALLNKLSNEEQEIDNRYNDNVQRINTRIEEDKPDPIDPRMQQVEEYLTRERQELADKNDLASPHYDEFLDKYPIFDAFHEEYDRELAEEAWNIRKSYNRHLKLTGKSSFIGKEDYYHIVDQKIADHFNSSSSEPNHNQRGSDMDRDYTNRQFNNPQPEPKLSNFRDAQGRYVDEYGQLITQQPQRAQQPQRPQHQRDDHNDVITVPAQSAHLGMPTRAGNNMPTSLAHHSLDDRERIRRIAEAAHGMRVLDNSRDMTKDERVAFYENYFSQNPL
jgi:hypothetical protein